MTHDFKKKNNVNVITLFTFGIFQNIFRLQLLTCHPAAESKLQLRWPGEGLMCKEERQNREG